ncbi:caronic anhyrase [Gracilaria domingensis]|nr:caronic anhyrase [Gracilaria domingensis]
MIFLFSFLVATHVALASFVIKPVIRSDEAGGYSYNRAADNGPSHWDSLDEGYGSCSAGHHQSPINVAAGGVHNVDWQNAPSVRPHTGVFSFNNGTSNFALQCDTETRCGHTMYNGKRFDVVNLHFHSPSEHTVNGKHYPVEAHMVHSSSDGSLLVISTLFTDKTISKHEDQNGLLSPPTSVNHGEREFHSIVNHIQHERHTFPVHMPSFIGRRGYCIYQGSLTTPPCSEEVTWLIAIQEQAVSSSDVESYIEFAASAEFGNNRPVHRLNGREVTCMRPPRHPLSNYFARFHNFFSRFNF